MLEPPPACRLSVIVVVFDMAREAPRTLASLAPDYQLGMKVDEYEVLVIDNGSPEPFDPGLIRSLPSCFRYFYLDSASPSPAAAINFGASKARGDLLGVMIDGARLLSPGLLRSALDASKIHSRPVISSVGFHLGPDLQMRSMLEGYDQAQEDALLESIAWPNEGYRLFEICALAGASRNGWFRSIDESNCLFMSRALFDELGGYEEGFTSAGGGLVNLDFYARACQAPDARLIMQLGEGTFHQIHGGTVTGLSLEDGGRYWREVLQPEYQAVRGKSFEPIDRRATLFGEVHDLAMPWIETSCARWRDPL